MKSIKKYIWPIIAAIALIIAVYFLYHKFQNLTWREFSEDLKSIPFKHYVFAFLSTCVAYTALAWYDRIALIHLNVHHISWLFISVCSFTTYALAHNLGASVFSGAIVRYRAYSAKGLSASQIALLVALCSFTFAFGVILLGGIVLTLDPDLLSLIKMPEDGPFRMPEFLVNPVFAQIVGYCLLGFVLLYAIGSLLHMRPLKIRRLVLEYPRPPVMIRQFIAGPLELLGAAGIIYFALPEAGNPGFITVLAIFLASFSVALISSVPGGVGVFEALFIAAMPNIDESQVLAALVIFRLFYFLIPLAISLIIVVLYERARFRCTETQKTDEG